MNALDFIVKPISYYVLVLKLERALHRLENEGGGAEITVSVDDVIVKVRAVDLKYAEVQGHSLICHTTKGDYRSYGSLKKIEEMLGRSDFVRCNACYLVNLKYVTSIRGSTVYLGDVGRLFRIPNAKILSAASTTIWGGAGDVRGVAAFLV